MSPKPSSRASSSASTSRSFDKELAELEALAESLRTTPTPNAAQIEHLRRSLAHHNNFLGSEGGKAGCGRGDFRAAA